MLKHFLVICYRLNLRTYPHVWVISLLFQPNDLVQSNLSLLLYREFALRYQVFLYLFTFRNVMDKVLEHKL